MHAVLAPFWISLRFGLMLWVSSDAIDVPTDTKVHLWQVTCSAWSDRLSDLESTLSEDEIARADRFLRPEHRDLFVCAHGVLRRILGACYACGPEKLVFGYGPHDKPFVKHPTGGGTSWQFNLSHSGDSALVVVNSDVPVGVDVERVSRTIEIESLSRRFFSQRESEAIMALPPADRKRAFIDTWVCKEAFIKAVGEGLSMPLDSFAVRFDGANTTVGFGDGPANPHLEDAWTIERFEVAPDYRGAVAVARPEMMVRRFILR